MKSHLAFISLLEQNLRARDLPDAEIQMIISDYEAHFETESNAGKTEAEILEKMSDPEQLASEYVFLTEIDTESEHPTHIGMFSLLWRGIKTGLIGVSLLFRFFAGQMLLIFLLLFGIMLTASGPLGIFGIFIPRLHIFEFGMYLPGAAETALTVFFSLLLCGCGIWLCRWTAHKNHDFLERIAKKVYQRFISGRKRPSKTD